MDRARELVRLSQAGDEEAKSTLIQENSGLVWNIVKRFRGRGCEAEDLYQIGVIGLIKCIDKFDLQYDVKFSTYAVPMIMGEIKRFLRDDGIIKVSRPLKETAVKAKYFQENLRNQLGYEPTIHQLSEMMGMPAEELIMAMDAGREVESIFQSVHSSDDGSAVYLIDKLSQQGGEEDFIDKIALKELLAQLQPKERQIIVLRYFEDKTQLEIAKLLGISQVQVSRIEKKIIQKLKERFE